MLTQKDVMSIDINDQNQQGREANSHTCFVRFDETDEAIFYALHSDEGTEDVDPTKDLPGAKELIQMFKNKEK